MKYAIYVLAVLALSAGVSGAAILNVDFNGARGASVGTTYAANGVLRADGSANDNPAVGTSSGVWNGILLSDPNTPVPASGLLDSGSNANATTLSLVNFTFQDNCPGCNYAHGDPANQPLLNDYLGAQNPAGNALPTLTIGNLTPNGAYDLYIYGTNGGSGAGSTWSVNGSATQLVSGNGPNPFATFSSGNDYVLFHSQADASGNLAVVGTPGPQAGYVILNGFQLTAVPEPASIGLLSLGSLALIRRCR